MVTKIRLRRTTPESPPQRQRRYLRWFIAIAVVSPPVVALAGRAVAPVGIHAIAMRNCGDICVTHFGAIPDDGQDDTEAIQAAVDATIDLGGGTVRFPAGIYDVSSIDVAPGLTLEGTGAVLKKLDMQSKWARTFTTQRHSHEGPTDSAPLIVRGLAFDGNRLNQGPYRNWEMEQQHSIFLTASGPGRLVASVEDCHFRDGVADGITVFTNVEVSIEGCSATDVFRGAVTVNGGNTEVHISGLRAGGVEHPSGIDIEISSRNFGYDGSLRTRITADGLLLEGDFDVGLRDGSTFLGNNIHSYPGPFHLYGEDSTIRISNSVFGVGPQPGSRVVMPQDVTFSNCSFISVPADTSQPGGRYDGLRFQFHATIDSLPIAATGARVRILDCDFQLAPGIFDEDILTAIHGLEMADGRDNQILVRGGSVASGFDRGVHLGRGGTVRVQGMSVDADTAFSFSGWAGFPLDVTLDGVSFGPSVVVPENIFTHSVGNTITHRNIFLDESQNQIATQNGIVNNIYRGRRVIEGVDPPVTTPGFVGDLYRLKVPVIGETYEWLCTRSDVDDATWNAFTFIGP